MNPPRKHYETRVEYLLGEVVNAGAPQHVVDGWVMQIIENRRSWSSLWDDAQHCYAAVIGKGTPIS